MNQFQIQMMKHLRSGKKQQPNSLYDTNYSNSQERKRSSTQTSYNSTSTNPFTQIESSTHYETKGLGIHEVDYIPEMSRESSAIKKRRTVELDPQAINQLITPSRVNVLKVENDSTNMRSLSTDFSSIKKSNFKDENKLADSIFQLRNRLIRNQPDVEQESKYLNKNEQIVNRIVHLESFYNFPTLYDKEEIESRRRSREYSQTLQERNELRRNRSLSANQQKFINSIIENGKTQYKKVKRVYSSSQSRLRFQSDKEQYSKDVFFKVYDDCKKSCKEFDSLIKSSNSLSRVSLQQPSINHPTFPPHVKQTDVQLKRINKEFKNNCCTIMNQIHQNQSLQRIGINQKFYELEESMRFSNTEKIEFTPLINSLNSKNLLESNNKQENLILSQQLNQNVNVSQFQGQNSNQVEKSLDSNGHNKLISSAKLQNSLNLNLNSPGLINSDNFDILNNYSVKSQKPSQGQQGCQPLVYSAKKYMNQCSSLVQLEKDLQKYREIQQLAQFSPDIQQQKQQQQQQQPLQDSNFNSTQKINQSKKITRKEYLQAKCRHNITTMYCSICNRQVKSKI
ncbi:hypothetical protein TTHERM_00852740 (macronuclear) [Tetrahymena thermophila SB210]|uniref:Uncharacterized protein n=1 Tax=Tetrahymena thermophila (strain SB210) TaxID=312017 RepID=Q24E66_TETTS|nr:hypothetical protein TTHERM_00852740 [Tetrahymena thermophila SB210]EAS06035.2 hypothetical protein TTHERM_00852740 [Tetrahymena thermophila SB210]|eukprot:XP_001026280.2 hypothetical protein TTHERM_00852740 [Tetrahymena thermophila SB210]